MSHCNIIAPGERIYSRAQSTVCQAIVEVGSESCREWRDNLPLDSVIAMDGSWSQHQDALLCVVDFIDANSGKAINLKFLKNRSVLRMVIISSLQMAWKLRVFGGPSIDATRTRL
jgi:hypothetical protein